MPSRSPSTRSGANSGFLPLWKSRIASPLILVALIWATSLLFLSNIVFWPGLGVMPRELHGLWGIIWMPFIHASLTHLLSNTSGLLVLGLLVSTRGRWYFWRVTVAISLLTGFGVWLFAQSGVHIGASGLVFGFFGFLVIRGLYDQTLASLLVAIVVIAFYGGLVWGVLPTDRPISWEGHLAGMIAGGLVARVIHGRRSTLKISG